MNQRASGSGGGSTQAAADAPESEADYTASEAAEKGREVTDRAREEGGAVADRARQEGRELTGTATEEARDVAETARHQARDVAETAREQVGHVTDEAATQARGVADQAMEQLHSQARKQTHRAAESMLTTSEQLNALADGRPEDAGHMDEYARQAAEQVARVADRVEEKGFDGIVDDVGEFARRRPGAFLLGTAAAGFLVGRLGRNGATGNQR